MCALCPRLYVTLACVPYKGVAAQILHHSREMESEFVSLMREHRALARVDLRGCSGKGGKKMGILKVCLQADNQRGLLCCVHRC